MTARAKRTQSDRRSTTDGKPSGAFVVPSHGRLARRGSTEIIEDDAEQRAGAQNLSGASR